MLRIFLAVALLLLAACGGSTPPDLEEPAGSVAFPAAGGQTDAADLAVTGRASDDRGVAAVRVNGVAATSSDRFATWSARVPLLAGANSLRVEIEDGAGNITVLPPGASVERVGSLLAAPNDLVLGAGAGTAYVTDSALDAVLSIDPATGARASIATGLDSPTGIAQGSGSELLVLESLAGTLFGLEPASGVRRVISGDSRGTGPSLRTGLALDADLATGLAYVLVSFPPALLAVDLSTGDRSTVAAGPDFALRRGLAIDGTAITAGSGGLLEMDLASGALTRHDLALGNPTAVARDGDAVVIADAGLRGVVEFDLSTGASAVVVADEFGFPIGIELAGTDALIVDSGADALLRLDRQTESVVNLSRSRFGAGDPLFNPRDLVLDGSGSRALVIDSQLGLVAIDLASGGRTRIEGSGDPLAIPVALASREGTGQVLVVDSALAALFRVEVATGARTALGGSGPALSLPSDVAFDSGSGLALLIDADLGNLLTADPVSGDRVILSSELDRPIALACDAAGRRAFVADAGLRAIAEIDLADGGRRLLDGVVLDEPAGLAWDAGRQRLLLVERGSRELLAVDPRDGATAALTANDTGSGPRLVSPQAVAGGDSLLLLDSGLAALLEIEERSGDRLLRSK